MKLKNVAEAYKLLQKRDRILEQLRTTNGRMITVTVGDGIFTFPAGSPEHTSITATLKQHLERELDDVTNELWRLGAEEIPELTETIRGTPRRAPLGDDL